MNIDRYKPRVMEARSDSPFAVMELDESGKFVSLRDYIRLRDSLTKLVEEWRLEADQGGATSHVQSLWSCADQLEDLIK